jgi:hypothetical protein
MARTLAPRAILINFIGPIICLPFIQDAAMFEINVIMNTNATIIP